VLRLIIEPIYLFSLSQHEEQSTTLENMGDNLSDEEWEDIEEAIENGDFDEAEESDKLSYI